MLRYLFCVLLAPCAAMPVLAQPALAQTAPVEEVSVTLRTADLSDPARATEVYARLEQAAHKACDATPWNDVTIAAANAACRDDALEDAVRHLGWPALTAVHTADVEARKDAAKARLRH